MPQDLLYPWPEDATLPQLAGSVFVNNTTYAGCDIKIIVNLYDQGVGVQKQIMDLQDQLSKSQTALDKIEGQISGHESTISNAKPGTPGFFNATGARQTKVEASYRLREQIQSTQARLQKLQNEAPGRSSKVLAEAQTLSLSTYRDKQAVRACGSVYPKGFTRGPREIGGSIIFTVFNEHVLARFLEAHASDFDAVRFTSAVLDQLPPVDISISFANEYGSLSRMTIYGVEFTTEGQTMSIEDLITENVVNYVARDWDPMRAVGNRKIDETSHIMQSELGKKASDLLLEDDYQDIKGALSPFERFTRRRNPFL